MDCKCLECAEFRRFCAGSSGVTITYRREYEAVEVNRLMAPVDSEPGVWEYERVAFEVDDLPVGCA